MAKKKLVFLTGTRADFGKLKSLISVCQRSSDFEVHIFATGMHMNSKYGKTVEEIEKSGFLNIFQFENHDTVHKMDLALSKTIEGFSHYISKIRPDLIVVHGDRVEALAGAIVGSLNNVLVSHIEGGELSGTVDELIRHAVSKLAHIHFVSNQEAKRRLIQLGEKESSIYVIGSPDLDLMNPESLPLKCEAKARYNIDFEKYSIAMFHPVTTEYSKIKYQAKNFVAALLESKLNYIVIYPNNDLGSDEILTEYEFISENSKFKIFPSLRFEHFLTLLHGASFIIGNSSAGIREAPHYNVPTIDVGSRQRNRVRLDSVINVPPVSAEILSAIRRVLVSPRVNHAADLDFGEGNSAELFVDALRGVNLWNVDCQKQFQEFW